VKKNIENSFVNNERNENPIKQGVQQSTTEKDWNKNGIPTNVHSTFYDLSMVVSSQKEKKQ